MTEYVVTVIKLSYILAPPFKVVTVNATVFTLDIIELDKYTKYCVTVRARNQYGEGEESECVNATTDEDGKILKCYCETSLALLTLATGMSKAQAKFGFASQSKICLHDILSLPYGTVTDSDLLLSLLAHTKKQKTKAQ